MDNRIFTAILVVVGVPALLFGYILLTERIVGLFAERHRARIRPWLWLAPALILLTTFLILPTLATAAASLFNKTGKSFVGLANYIYFFTSDATLVALRNSFIWLVLLTAFVLGVGLVCAILFDRVRYEPFAKAVIFVPLAISFVGAGVIWRFMFDYERPGQAQIGTLNGALGFIGQDPVAFLLTAPWNTVWMIVVGAWIWTGFAMVILSAALKSISPELLEAARVDGAGEMQVFRSITFPLLLPTIAVVATTMIITALKAFDVVYVMTGGNYDTDILALQMYKQLFNFSQPGRAATVATVLILLIIPIMAINIRRFTEQEAIR